MRNLKLVCRSWQLNLFYLKHQDISIIYKWVLGGAAPISTLFQLYDFCGHLNYSLRLLQLTTFCRQPGDFSKKIRKSRIFYFISSLSRFYIVAFWALILDNILIKIQFPNCHRMVRVSENPQNRDWIALFKLPNIFFMFLSISGRSEALP